MTGRRPDPTVAEDVMRELRGVMREPEQLVDEVKELSTHRGALLSA
ncbi:hypothetical protein [Nonomuraea sp. 10N515B]